MQGQKVVYVVVFVLILILALNFTRNTFKKRKLDEKRRLREQQEVKFQKILKLEDLYREKILNEMFKEHNEICYKMFVFTVEPELIEGDASPGNSTELTPELPKLSRPSLSIKKPKKSNGNTNINNKTGSSEPVIYLFVLVLIYSLITAASDISQHYKKAEKNKDENGRRCSLREYANHQKPTLERRQSKGVANSSLDPLGCFAKAPMLGSGKSNFMSFDAGGKGSVSNVIQSQETRRMSVPESILFQNKKKPLLRKESVDVGLGSFDSDGDSPYLKRRVRMINRH